MCVRVFMPTSLSLSAAELEYTRQQDVEHLLHLLHKDLHSYSNLQAGVESNKHHHRIYREEMCPWIFPNPLVASESDHLDHYSAVVFLILCFNLF